MKRPILILAALFTILSLGATRRALVIGIGTYPAESGWRTINGDRDIPLVQETLAANGFDAKHIAVLKNQQATCAAIKRELERLIAAAQPGDYLYIHFSGHGQQITDLNGDEAKDSLDEAWIPYDAQYAYAKGIYEGRNHITDDQLNHYLHRMREKIGSAGKIVVIADACHSGDASRSDDDEEDTLIVRGTSDKFIIPNPQKQTSAVSYPIEWTFISACQPDKNNYEYRGNGSLTYALHQQRNNFAKVSTTEIANRIESCILHLIPYDQIPMVEMTIKTETDIFF